MTSESLEGAPPTQIAVLPPCDLVQYRSRFCFLHLHVIRKICPILHAALYPHEPGFAWGATAWKRASWARTVVLPAAMRAGLHVAWSDIDVVWFRDPTPLLEQHPEVLRQCKSPKAGNTRLFDLVDWLKESAAWSDVDVRRPAPLLTQHPEVRRRDSVARVGL